MAKDLLKYKGYVGSYDLCFDSGEICGKLEFINALVTFEAHTVVELQAEFENAVDSYLATCKELGYTPEKTLSGSFNVRTGPDLHKQIATKAMEDETSINQVVVEALKEYLKEASVVTHNHVHHVVSEDRAIADQFIYGDSGDSPRYSKQQWKLKDGSVTH